ncbi:MAG: glycerol kinase GlpK [Bacteroidales bacterium]|jgi:glycerol kinase|nr:glycerol kinase GlpK [Bacteroidales bacterium]
MQKKFILSLDQGTSSSRTLLFDVNTQIIATRQKEFQQYYPHPGWVEHDPDEIWESQLDTVKTIFQESRIDPGAIAAIGIANQRETVILWDKKTGHPVYRAIVWQDKRTADYCKQLEREGWSQYIKKNTGLIIDSYFSATKIHWILQNVPGVKERANKGEILAGTIDSWLIWKLTGGKLHITDYSNASRTMLFNIRTLQWDKKLLALFDIPQNMLPGVKGSSEVVGYSDAKILGAAIPLSGIAGDQQAALFGQTCLGKGTAKNTYGTGCFMLMNTGEKMVESHSGLVTTIAWGINKKINYALEGSVFIAGAAIKWLRDALHLIQSADETEKIARQVEDTEEVYVVPAFTGLGAPYWDMYARGAILGLTQGVTDKHIIRSTLESLAYQTMDVLKAMEQDSGIQLKALNVDGGASVNNFLMQFQANILNVDVIRPENVETTALGAALLAGLATGFWTMDEIIQKRKIEKIFHPFMEDELRIKLYNGWKKAVEKAKDWQQ